MRQLACLLFILPLLLTSCDAGKGRMHIQGEFKNLDQADFLIYSPDGGLEDIDTLHLVKGKFQREFAIHEGPYTFTVVYPNYSTLSFMASEGDIITINGDALALADVQVEGADSVIVEEEKPQPKLKVGDVYPKTDAIEKSRQPGKYLLVGFWASWKGGTSIISFNLRRALEKQPEKLRVLSYSLDADTKTKTSEENASNPAWDEFCDHQCWNSPAVQTLGINNLPYMILIDPQGKIIAMGSDYNTDIAPKIP